VALVSIVAGGLCIAEITWVIVRLLVG